VSALVASGLVNTWYLTNHMRELFGTDYGWFVQMKVGLFLAMLCLAAVNRLLVVGFYLLNLGYVTVAMRDRSGVYGAAGVMEELSVKVGYVLLVLGVVHLFNLFALGRYRRSRLAEHRGAPPLPPTGVLPRTPQPYDIAWANYHAAVAQAQAQANKSGRAVAVPPAPGQPADGGEHDWAEPA
jgi:hypothetical protein